MRNARIRQSYFAASAVPVRSKPVMNLAISLPSASSKPLGFNPEQLAIAEVAQLTKEAGSLRVPDRNCSSAPVPLNSAFPTMIVESSLVESRRFRTRNM